MAKKAKETPNTAVETNQPLTFLCVTCYFKGGDFMRAAKALGHKVLLITAKKLEKEEWPRESIDDIFYVADDNDDWNMDDVIKGVSYIARSENIDRVVALDDYDVEKAAVIREHLRVPGMGKTRSHYFRDKLAMRIEAHDSGIAVPEFIGVFNHKKISEYCKRVSPPWLIKPRSKASALGIKKLHNEEELWRALDQLGDEQSFYVLEKFEPGDVYHVDALTVDGKVVFARAHKYLNPPMEVAHEGRVFRSINVEYGSDEEKMLLDMNEDVLKSFGLKHGASHTEFIRSHKDGKLYFLETSARVGGANIVELVEASSGINLWVEWAKIEALRKGEKYELPKAKKEYAGILISLAKQETPDTSAYDDKEVWWRMSRKWHAGLIIKSKSRERIVELLDDYGKRFYTDFFASQPLPDKPTN
jgi:biotin carboxylase